VKAIRQIILNEKIMINFTEISNLYYLSDNIIERSKYLSVMNYMDTNNIPTISLTDLITLFQTI
jgi:hypothetical protein